MKAGIIGAGLVGTTMAVKLYQLGYSISGVCSRTESKARELAAQVGSQVKTLSELIACSELVLVATPDRVIESLIQDSAHLFHLGQRAVHFSGSLSSEVMSPIRRYGAKPLSIHPLQSFANVEVALNILAGTHFAVEGDDLEFGRKLVYELGGIPHCFAAEAKTLYHAGACFVSNYLVVLADIGVKLLEEVGFKSEEALRALLPLMQGTLANLAQVGLPKALTGPIARGDYPVVAAHLGRLPGNIGEIYSDLGSWATDIASAKGSLSDENREKLQRILLRRMGGTSNETL